MSDDPSTTLNQELATLRKAANTTMVWTWDKRYRTALLAVKPEAAQAIEEGLRTYFSDHWTAQTYTSAEKPIQSLVGFLAGLQGEQRLYAKDIGGELLAFAAFWPWAGNTNISIRIGVYRTNDRAGSSLTQIVEQLKAAFDVES